MAKFSKVGSEKGPFPERVEVLSYHFLRLALKSVVRRTLNWIEKAYPDLFLAAAWIYMKESAENIKHWTEGTILAGGTIVENIADSLPIPEVFRKVIESLGSDLPLNITEYFALRKARNDITFPEDYTGPKTDEIKKTLGEFATKFREGFRDFLAKKMPIFLRFTAWWDNLIARFKGVKGFHQHSFKAFRSAFLDMDVADRELLVAAFQGPLEPAPRYGFDRLAAMSEEEQPLSAQDLWNLLESHEYVATPEQLTKLARLSRRHLKFWLAMQDHDDWFNFLSPNLKAKVASVHAHMSKGRGQMADALNKWSDRQEADLERSAERNRKRNFQILGGLVGVGVVLFLWYGMSQLIPHAPLASALLTFLVILALALLVIWVLTAIKHRQFKEVPRG